MFAAPCSNIIMSNPWYPPPGPSYNFVMDNPPSNSREMRNRAEKMRRDKLNSYIGELATLVPVVSKSAKRMDKTSILRLTANYLRIYQTLLNGKSKQRMELPKHVDQYILEQLVCEQLGGFLLILTTAGKVVFVSHTVEHLLGHLQTDLMGQSIFNITSSDDHEKLRIYINSESVMDNDWKKYFSIRLKRATPRTESAVYEPVNLMGVHRPFCPNDHNQNASSTNNNKDITVASTSLNNDVLVFFVRIFRPEPLSDRLIEASKDEYVTRHLIDGRIINCDQRISLIAGYMTDEVSGLSAFKFMHREDVRWVMIALRQMYDRGESKGSSCYRLLSRNGQFIYLKTFGFLEIDDQGTVESFICVNTLVEEKEGLQLINEMKKRFSALINSHSSPITSCGSNESAIQAVEDPQQVDAAIVHLITNLPSPSSSEPCSTPSPRVYCNNNNNNNNNTNENQDCSTTTITSSTNASITTTNTIKTTITTTTITTGSSSSLSATLSTSTTTTECTPNKPYHVRIKTASKRPPSTDLGNHLHNKRHKSSSQLSSLPCSLLPCQKRPKITEITQQQDHQPPYPLRNNV